MHLLIFYFISSITIFTSYLTSWTPCVFLAINCQVFLLYLCICLELTIHMIRADIETEVSPIVGSEKQSEELVNYLLSEFESDPQKIWESNIFGKSLHELVNEGLQNKLSHMPEDAQMKLQDTLERIINEGSGGLICIIL